MKLGDARIQLRGELRDARLVVGAGGDHDLLGQELQLAGDDPEAARVVGGPHVADTDAGTNRERHPIDVGFEVVGDFVLGREGVTVAYEIGDLFFFAESDSNRKITHVGMSLGGWRMIHSSRSRNGVYIDDVQEVGFLKEIFAGAGSFLR